MLGCCKSRKNFGDEPRYNLPLEGGKQPIGETPVLRHPDCVNTELPVYLDPSVTTMAQIHMRNYKSIPDNKFLGYRERLAGEKDKYEEKFTWMTYKEVIDKAFILGNAMERLHLATSKNEWKNFNMKLIAIYSKNSKEYILFDAAASLFGYTSVPIYDTLGEEATEFMFKQTNLETCFVTCNHITGLGELISSGRANKLTNLVILDDYDLTEANKSTLNKLNSSYGVVSYNFNDLLSQEVNNAEPSKDKMPTSDNIYVISYTSGTTGEPKGAMVSHKNIVATGQNDKFDSVLNSVVPLHLSYLPLPHIFERIIFAMICNKCGVYAMFNGDVQRIKEDLAVLKPNMFVTVPRLFNKFYDLIKLGMSKATGVKKTIAERAVSVKLDNLRNNGGYSDWLYDRLVFNKIKAILGGNVKFMITGSAPISTSVLEFLKICFGCPIAEGYGQTEGCGAEFVQDLGDASCGNVGGCLKSIEFKLVDVPEMNYTANDKDEDGRPAPRGEICVRGAGVIPGYFKNQEKTDEAIDKDGFLHSGDIGTILPGTRALKITDRIKNIFKLSQGEYVAPDRLEQIYKTAMGVDDIFVYGDSFKSCLIAIVVANGDGLKSYSGNQSLAIDNVITGQSDINSINTAEIHKIILETLNKSASAAKLKGFERIKKIYVDNKNFTENGLCTSTFKLKRNEAKNFYMSKINDLYDNLD